MNGLIGVFIDQLHVSSIFIVYRFVYMHRTFLLEFCDEYLKLKTKFIDSFLRK